MAAVIGSLRVDLGLDSAKFQRGAKDANNASRKLRKQFAKVASAAAAMAAVVSAAALRGAQQIDDAAKAARRLDASIGGFRALEVAAQEAGVNLSSLTNDIQTLNREVASIGTTGNGKRALEKLGITAKQLAGLDADAKIALIADQVKKMGYDAGQTTAILRDLGVRNREMALLVLQGGDAIRSARKDVKDYGLEISTIDAKAIEKANDAIGRLGLIGKYASQEIAVALVPAMGRLAEAMTDSLREGGALRLVIDGLVDNIQRIITIVSVAVTAFGVRYAAALAMAAYRAIKLAGAMTVLRGAIIRTGIGAIIVGVGELVYQFTKLVKKTGSVGGAFKVLKDLFFEVVDRIKIRFTYFKKLIQDILLSMSQLFLHFARSIVQYTTDKINRLVGAWVGYKNAFVSVFKNLVKLASYYGGAMMDGIIDKIEAGMKGIVNLLNKMSGISIPAPDLSEWKSSGVFPEFVADIKSAFSDAMGAEYVSAAPVTAAITQAIEALTDKRLALGLEMAGLKDAFMAPLESLKALREAAREAGEDVPLSMNEIAEGVASAGKEASNAMQNATGFFTSIVNGSKSASQAISDLAKRMADKLLNRGFEAILGNLFGGNDFFKFVFNANGNAFDNGKILPFAKGGVVDRATLFPMAGNRTGVMGEAGAEAILPLSRGSDGKLGVKAQSGGGVAPVTVNITQHIDARATNNEAVQNLQIEMEKQQAGLSAQIIDTVRQAQDDRVF